MTDTLYALATPPGRGAIAVMRLSGPATAGILERLGAGGLEPRRAGLRRLRDETGAMIDEALVLWMPGPASFTGEDCAELHLHGGRAVPEAASRALSAFGARPAGPGEFTRRAFENGRLDLTRAEAIADLVDAESDTQRKQALDQLGGALAERYAGFRRSLLTALALLEAEIDFPDEDGAPDTVGHRVRPLLDALRAEIEASLSDASRGERIREGYRIALIGAANAGKSTLFNRLTGRDAAIVTPTPGTTRDVLEAHLVIGGYTVVLMDTAGLRETGDAIEAEGVRRARVQAEGAALRLWVRAPGDEGEEAAALARPDDLVLLNKSDLGRQAAPEGLAHLAISAGTGEGLEALTGWLEARIARDLSGADFPAVTRERHRVRLERARDHVAAAVPALARGPELAAEELRHAARALSEVTGEVGVEDVLGEVFASFCIGK